MKTVNETFNGLREFPVAGRYFELLSTLNPVDVTIYGKGDVVLARLLAIEEGVCHERKKSEGLEPFQRIEVATGANEAVKFFIGDGITFNRSVPADVTDRASRVLGTLAGAAHTQANKTAGAASAELVAANAARKHLSIQNQDGAETIYVRTDGGAATVSNAAFKILPGETWTPAVPPTGQVNAIRGAAADVAVNVITA